MYRRLVKVGIRDDGTLADRVAQRMTFMEKEKVLRRNAGSNRYTGEADAIEDYLGSEFAF